MTDIVKINDSADIKNGSAVIKTGFLTNNNYESLSRGVDNTTIEEIESLNDYKFKSPDYSEHDIIYASGTGNSQVVAGVEGRTIKVLGYTLLVEEDTTVQFFSDDTAISGPMTFSSGGGAAPDSSSGLFETEPGEDLNIRLGGAVEANGHITYRIN